MSDVPICSVNVEKIQYLDTRNAENLHSLHSGTVFRHGLLHRIANFALVVFAKNAPFIEEGRRLENLSWRIWNRETLCCQSQPQFTTSPTITTRPRPKKNDVPELSASAESLASEKSDEGWQGQVQSTYSTAPKTIENKVPHPLRSSPTMATSRGTEKHISSLRIARIVSSIQEKQDIEPLSPTIVDAVPSAMPSSKITPRPASPTAHAPMRSSDSSASTAPLSSPESDRSTTQTVKSDTSAELLSAHNIVRGFSPNRVSSSFRSHTHLAPAPVPTKPVAPTKNEGSKRGVFLLGGSSGEDESSFEDHMCSQPKTSSLSAGIAGLKRPLGGKKKTSFKDEVEARTLNNKFHEDEEVFESDDEDEIPDSAIEDDSDLDEDEEEWEDDGSESAEITVNHRPLFQRVDSKPNLVSHRSLLTSLMHQEERAAAFSNMAISTPALRKSRTQTQMDPPIQQEDISLRKPNHYGARSKPINMATANTHVGPMALSPKTTRTRMITREVDEPMRKSMLWERKEKKGTIQAVLKRRHTAHDVTNLKNYPGEEDGQNIRDGSRNDSTNHFFEEDSGDYNTAGW